MSLFQNGIRAKDKNYQQIRDEVHPNQLAAKELIESLWITYERFADRNFVDQFAKDFDARFWEMDLTVTLIEQGHDVSCPKPGPDVCINTNDGKLWFEAIAPKLGNGADKVPEAVSGTVQAIPTEKIILRYRSAIEEKLEKYNKYIQSGTISKNEPYIIAINGCQLPNYIELGPERIIRSVFPIGPLFVTFDRETADIVESGYSAKYAIKKENGSDVSTSCFLLPEYAGVSAILFSSSDCYKRKNSGNDWIIIHNPLSTNPLPKKLISSNKEVVIQISEETYELKYS